MPLRCLLVDDNEAFLGAATPKVPVFIDAGIAAGPGLLLAVSPPVRSKVLGWPRSIPAS